MLRLQSSGTAVLFVLLSFLPACGEDSADDPTDTSDTSADTTPGSDTLDEDTTPGSDAGDDATDTGVQPATCTDGLVNGDETSVDCGGGACPACGDAKACLADSDCASNYCATAKCVGDVEVTIAAIQQHTSSVDCTNEVGSLVTRADVKIRGVVTAPVRSLTDALSGTYLGGATSAPDGGIQLVWPSSVGAEGLEPGAVVAVTASVNEFFCNTQLVAATIEVVSVGAAPAPRDATPAEVQAEAWEGTLIRLEDVVVSDSSTVASGYVTLEGGLQLQLGDFGVAVAEGTTALAAVVGVVKYSFSDYRVAVIEVELVADPCAADPCANGGVCAPDGFDFACECAAGFEGETCATDIDDCAADPCPNACTDGVDSFICEGDSCEAPRVLVADGANRWTGSGDTGAAGLTAASSTTGCVNLGQFPTEGTGPDEVWSFVAAEPGDYRVTVTPTAGADLFVYAFGTGCDGSCFGYNDTAAGGGADAIDISDLAQGATVTVVVDGYQPSAAGAYDLVVERTACPGGECIVPGGEGDVALHRVVVGGNGLPVISSQTTASDLRLRLCESPTCASGTTHELLVPSVGTPGNHSVAPSPSADGGVWLAHPNASGKLELKRCAGLPCSTWPTQMTTTGGTVFEASVAVTTIEDRDVAVVVWTESTGAQSQDLMFANKFDGVATTPFVPVVLASNVDSPRVAFGSGGRPAILYRSGGSDVGFTWKVTYCSGVVCTSKITHTVATLAGSLFGKLDLAIGSNGFPIMVYASSATAITFVACGDGLCGDGNRTTRTLEPSPGRRANSNPTIAVPRLPGAHPSFAYYSADSVLNVQQCLNATCTNSFAPNYRPSVATNGQGIAAGADGDLVLVYRGIAADSPTLLKHLIVPTL